MKLQEFCNKNPRKYGIPQFNFRILLYNWCTCLRFSISDHRTCVTAMETTKETLVYGVAPVGTVGTVAAAPVYYASSVPGAAYNPAYVNQQPQYPHGINHAYPANPNGGGGQYYAHTDRLPPPPYGQWESNICNWPANLWPSCYCACCCYCGIYLIAQMAEKTKCMRFHYVLLVWGIAVVVGIIIQALSPGAALSFVYLPATVSIIIAIALRLHIVHTTGIRECGNPGCMNNCGECCCGFWCHSCSVAQMARHLYGYSKILDGDADIHRPDGYLPQQV